MKNKLLLSSVSDFGMKTYTFQESYLELPFCAATTGKEMELVCLMNTSGKPANVRICGTPFHYGISEGGILYCVFCQGEFVQSFPRIQCCNTRLTVCTGAEVYEMEEFCTSSQSAYHQPICGGLLGLDHDGAILIWNYRCATAEKHNPLVFVQAKAGIDSMGNVILPKDYAPWLPILVPCIAAADPGDLCITSDRKILLRGKVCMEDLGPAIRMERFSYGYLVLTIAGDVYFCEDGEQWLKVGEHAVSITAYNEYAAYADTEGTVYCCQYKDGRMVPCTVVSYPERRITELSLSYGIIAILFSDCTFDAVDWSTGKTVLGTRFRLPHIHTYK